LGLACAIEVFSQVNEGKSLCDKFATPVSDMPATLEDLGFKCIFASNQLNIYSMRSLKLEKNLDKLGYIPSLRSFLSNDVFVTGIFVGHPLFNLEISHRLVQREFSNLFFEFPNQFAIKCVSFGTFYRSNLFFRSYRTKLAYSKQDDAKSELVLLRNDSGNLLGYLKDFVFAYSPAAPRLCAKFAIVWLASEQNGILDLNQPGSIALFDVNCILSKVVINTLNNAWMALDILETLPV
jgi:hypothetical protein